MEERKEYVVVTGACGGLGRAFCNELVKENNLILCGRNINKLEELKKELVKINENSDILLKVIDLEVLSTVDDFINFIVSENIKIKQLVNNAGYITEGSIIYAKPETLLTTIKVNCEGTIYLTKKLLDIKKDDEQLNIITVSSMAGNYPMPYMAIYASTKSLLTNFMLALKNEYKKKNVKLTVVQPGGIATNKEMVEAIKAQGFKGKITSTPASKIAKNSIKANKKNKSVYVPGFFNKLTKILSNFLPNSLKIKMVSGMWKKSQAKRGIK